MERVTVVLEGQGLGFRFGRVSFHYEGGGILGMTHLLKEAK